MARALDASGQKPTNSPGHTAARFPIIDVHCDLLHYLATVKDSDPRNPADIGCAIPFLRTGNVKLQVLAIYSGDPKAGPRQAAAQCLQFRRLLLPHSHFTQAATLEKARNSLCSQGTSVVASIENASCLCSDDESLDKALERLEQVKRATGRVLYISLTHNGENRFGGGNQTTIGLKGDGAALLDYLDCQNVAVDLSHASDALAHGILDHIEARDLSVPVVASHSNFRGVFHHARNLPDELARAVIDRNGLIGINFVRAFLHPEDPSFLAKHILYGLKIGAKNALCFGSDYFHWKGHPDQSRAPFFFQAHADAGKYQSILRSLADELGLEQSRALAFGNAMQFLHRIWKV